jgi:hypothetical protein
MSGLHVPSFKVEYEEITFSHLSVHGHSIKPEYISSGGTFDAFGTMPCRPCPGSVVGSVFGSRFVVSISMGCSTAVVGEYTCAPYPGEK